jgi:hypothetical protein
MFGSVRAASEMAVIDCSLSVVMGGSRRAGGGVLSRGWCPTSCRP